LIPPQAAPLFALIFQEGALCALDMLSVAGLVNYIGKVELPLGDDPAEGIAIRPVLLRKGNTHLGLYGIGNVKDARMHFELRSNRVRLFMPRDKSDWFNLLLLHQNRCGGFRSLK
jgi:double-strand break repair protein MRE11